MWPIQVVLPQSSWLKPKFAAVLSPCYSCNLLRQSPPWKHPQSVKSVIVQKEAQLCCVIVTENRSLLFVSASRLETLLWCEISSWTGLSWHLELSLSLSWCLPSCIRRILPFC